jgi:alpha-mannosidase
MAGQGSEAAAGPLMELDGQGATLEALKRSEDGAGLIARIWETHGHSSTVSVRLPDGTRQAEIVNLLERDPQPLTIEDGKVQLALAPFQIVTLKLQTGTGA